MADDSAQDFNELGARYREATERDLFVYSGPINGDGADKFVDRVASASQRSHRVALFLTTYGGDAHSAFRIARALAGYDHVRLLIAGQCKSAGTLVALAAHEIAFGPWGELGPLDVQLSKPDEIFSGHSGLDALQALAIVTEHGYDAFRSYVVDLTAGAGISTPSATQIAASLVSGLFEPIAAQIDPHRLGEAERAIKIANKYGERLSTSNVLPGALDTLISGYPTHGFVIDRPEATRLFEKVDLLADDERHIAEHLESRGAIMRYPSEGDWPVILGATETLSAADEPEEETRGDISTRSSEALDRAEPRSAGTDGARASR